MSADTINVGLPAEDAVELGELLASFVAWIDHDPARAERGLVPFVWAGYDTADLRADLSRFALLLGAIDPRLVSGPPTEDESWDES